MCSRLDLELTVQAPLTGVATCCLNHTSARLAFRDRERLIERVALREALRVALRVRVRDAVLERVGVPDDI